MRRAKPCVCLHGEMAVRDGGIHLGVYTFGVDGSAWLIFNDETFEEQFTVAISVSAARFTLLPAAEGPRPLPLIEIGRSVGGCRRWTTGSNQRTLLMSPSTSTIQR